MNIRKLSILGLIGIFITCEKSPDKSLEQEIETKALAAVQSGVEPELRYEIYEPINVNPYLEFYQGMIDLFNENLAEELQPINRAVFLMEGGLNYFFSDSTYLEEDSTTTIFQQFNISLEAGSVKHLDLADAFKIAYQKIKSVLDGHSQYTYSISDVQVNHTSNADLSLVVITHFLVNATSISSWAWPNVPPATVGREAGNMVQCGSIIHSRGAWQHVQLQVRQVLPNLIYPVNKSPKNHPFFNVVRFDTDITQLVTLRPNGTFMLGRQNDPYHSGLVTSSSCVSPAEQDFYSSAVSNCLYSYVKKRTFYDGVHQLNVKKQGTNYATWFFNGWFVKTFYAQNNPKLTSAQIGLF